MPMVMKKSLFAKLFVIFVSIMLLALVIMGSMLTGFAGNYWMQEKQSALFTKADAVSQKFLDLSGRQNFATELQRIVDVVAQSSGGLVLITDTTGIVIMASSTPSAYTGQPTVPAIVVDRCLEGQYSGLGNLDGALSENHYVVGVPIQYNGLVVGAVLAAEPYRGLHTYITNMLKIFLLASLIVVGLIFIAVYIMSMHIVSPIRAMAEAARCMSKGDFSRRIRVDRQDEVGELAVAFNNMTMSIAAGEQMRRGFIANVSHELKTPMTTISGFIDGILDGTISCDEQSRYLEIVSQEIKRLSRLVVAMLSLSKLEAGEMKISPTTVDLTEIIVNIMISFEKSISNKELDIRGLDTVNPTIVTADPDLMHQALYNLIDNAIKYTPPKGCITIRADRREDGGVIVAIRNSGKGISSKDLPHVFDRFYKADKSRGTDRTGAGLGLYLVKTIISLHGGQITVKSIEHEYCEFEFHLDSGKFSTPRELKAGPVQGDTPQ